MFLWKLLSNTTVHVLCVYCKKYVFFKVFVNVKYSKTITFAVFFTLMTPSIAAPNLFSFCDKVDRFFNFKLRPNFRYDNFVFNKLDN